MIAFDIGDIITQSSAGYPQKTALVFEDAKYSYQELNNLVNNFAQTLIAHKVKKGDKVALLITNSPEFLIAFFAVAKIGAVIVPLNTHLKLRELAYLFENCRAKTLITNIVNEAYSKDVLANLTSLGKFFFVGEQNTPAIKNLEQSLFFWSRKNQQANAEEPDKMTIDVDEAVVIYTSGTTGKPKGVLLSHLNIISNVNSVITYLRLTEYDKALMFLPMFYSYTISQILTTLRVGGTIVLMKDFLFPQQALQLVEKERVTGLAGVPASFNILLRINKLSSFDLSSLRYILNAGGPIYPAALEKLMERFPGVEIVNNYGCSEAAPRATYLDFKHLKKKIGSIGKAIPNVEVRVLNYEGREVSPGEMGEIVIRGSNVMLGYLNNPESTNEALQPDGLHTGDFASVDEDGFIFIKGRKVDIINCGGEKISAKEVEAVLMAHDKVFESAVIGIPDKILGEAVKAYIVPNNGGISTEEILTHCAQRLAAYKVPKVIDFLDELPKTASGKIQKHLLPRAEAVCL